MNAEFEEWEGEIEKAFLSEPIEKSGNNLTGKTRALQKKVEIQMKHFLTKRMVPKRIKTVWTGRSEKIRRDGR